MIAQILYKLEHSATGEWAAHITPPECRDLIAYIEQLELHVARLAKKKAVHARHASW